MYNYPYGDNQQINLNWIISEIIALHQRLDPDYTAPTFTQIYPFSDTQQLNLDWILTELKALKDLAPTPPPTEEIDEIGQALIAGAYDATTSYQKNDYIVQDGKVYRANAATTGTFDPTKWNEVMLGDDLAIITRWADTTNAYLNSLAARNVANDSSVTGTTVKDALNNLIDAINDNAETYLVADTTWEQGSISSTGIDTESTTRIRTKNYIPVTNVISVSGVIDSGYMFGIAWYNSSKTFISDNGWYNTTAKVDKPINAAYCRIIFAFSNNATITPAESSHIKARLNMTVKNAIDIVNDKAIYDIFDEGIYAYNNPILAAYSTGSGNYIDFFMPIKVNPELTIVATYEQSYRHEGDSGDTHTVAYLNDARIDSTVGMNANITIVKKTESGITFEIGFTNTQTPSKPATICIARLVITATR